MGNGLVLGYFDGVHIAHQSVIESAVKNSSNPILVTLKNFSKTQELVLTREESLKKAKSFGIKDIVELDFQKVVNFSAEEFLKYLYKEFSPEVISTGFNYTFGKNKSGNTVFLAENQAKYGYKYFCIPSLKYQNEIVSTSRIKEYLKCGQLEMANTLLGSNFLLEGIVIKGAQLGRKIGFPTANMEYNDMLVKLPFGVYCVDVGGSRGVMNWGLKPTVHNIAKPILETHILDFSGNLYNKNLKIEVLKFIRNEKKFKDLEELKLQIHKDIKACSEL